MMLLAQAPGLPERMAQPSAPREGSGELVSPFTRASQEPAKRGASPEREGLELHKSGPQALDKQTMAARLSFLVAALGSQFQPGSLGLVQVWTSRLGRKWSGVSRSQAHTTVLDTHRNAYCVDDPALQDLRDQSCQYGITGSGLGMLGKVWSTGALQVVQQIGIIPQSVHPRNKLKGEAVRSVAEVVYIPIYVEGAPEAGVQAVMEIMVSSSAWEAMVVANLISFVSSTLNDLKLSLFKPERRSGPAAPGSPAASMASASSQPSSPQAEDKPKRSLSRSGSSRMLSLENLQKAGQAAGSPESSKPPLLAERAHSASICEPFATLSTAGSQPGPQPVPQSGSPPSDAFTASGSPPLPAPPLPGTSTSSPPQAPVQAFAQAQQGQGQPGSSSRAPLPRPHGQQQPQQQQQQRQQTPGVEPQGTPVPPDLDAGPAPSSPFQRVE